MAALGKAAGFRIKDIHVTGDSRVLIAGWYKIRKDMPPQAFQYRSPFRVDLKTVTDGLQLGDPDASAVLSTYGGLIAGAFIQWFETRENAVSITGTPYMKDVVNAAFNLAAEYVED